MNRKILIIDHFDSFTYNLQQYIGEIESNILVMRTNAPFEMIKKAQPTHLVLSPGPGHPRDVRCFGQAIEYWEDKIPILGVCLGHQALALAAGAEIKRNYRIMHGKESVIQHNGKGIFSGVDNPLVVMRYHSLVVAKEDCETSNLEITAWTEDGEVMGVRYRDNPMMNGVQFHPESLFTQGGKKILENFLSI